MMVKRTGRHRLAAAGAALLAAISISACSSSGGSYDSGTTPAPSVDNSGLPDTQLQVLSKWVHSPGTDGEVRVRIVKVNAACFVETNSDPGGHGHVSFLTPTNC